MADLGFIIVAVDGGAASGKSSTSRAVSARFHLMHVDTGSFYRAVTAELLRRGVKPGDLTEVKTLLPLLRFSTRVTGRAAEMEIDGRVAGEEIRSQEVNNAVSHFAAIPELRAALLAYQRGQVDVAKANGFRGLIMEGRDITSVIFPSADFRIFLFADPVERARRRADQGQQDQVAERDRLDTQRKVAPLACPPGALAIDSTQVNLQEQDQKWVGRLDVLFVQRDNNGNQYNGLDDSIDLKLSAESYKKFVQNGFVYSKLVDRAALAKTIRIVVRDSASGAIGSLTVALAQI